MNTCPKFPLRLKTASAVVLVSITLGGLVGCGGGSPAAPTPPPLIPADETTGSKVMSWFAQISDSLHEVALGVAGIAEGNIAAGVSEFAAAGLGLIGKGLESGDSSSGDDQAKQLNAINGKLDTLIGDVQFIANLETNTNLLVLDLTNLVLMQPMSNSVNNAQLWLDSYYTGLNTLQSRAWVNWKMAGCQADVTCPQPYPAVTAANLAAFRQAYMQHPAKKTMTLSTDNFPLWWAYSVLPEQATGSAKYIAGGGTASQNEDAIYKAIVKGNGTDPNGLVSYMNYFMNQSSNTCAKDLTDPACDLYTSVYQPLEAYFALAIGRQSQLVMAQAEAWTVLAQKDPAANGSGGSLVMNNYNLELNEEVEVFLQVAEQLASYRLADGRTDWSNFAATDAGRLLARADFIVAKLAGANYVVDNTIGPNTPAGTSSFTSSPWPSDGIVGRIFYADPEQTLDKTGTRSVCAASGQPCSGIPLLQIAENVPSLRTVTGGKPYLVWSRAVDPKSGAVTLLTGTGWTQWRVQRLKPQPATTTTPATATTPAVTTVLSLPVGFDYQVASTHSPSLLAKFGFLSYDRNFVTPPLPDPRPVNATGPDSPWVTSFGSFNAVEGAIGPYGLKFDTNTFVKGSSNMPSVVYADSYSVSKTTPGALYSVTYVPNDYYTRYANDTPKNWGGVGTKPGTWSASTVVQLVIPAGTASNVKFSWPSTLDVNLSSDNRTTSGLFSTEYYSSATFKQQILSGGKVLTDISGKGTTSDVLTECSVKPFVSCKLNLGQSVDVMVSSATAIAGNITFVANFSTEVEQYKTGSLNSKIMRTSIAPSVANWTIQTPIVTLIN